MKKTAQLLIGAGRILDLSGSVPRTKVRKRNVRLVTRAHGLVYTEPMTTVLAHDDAAYLRDQRSMTIDDVRAKKAVQRHLTHDK